MPRRTKGTEIKFEIARGEDLTPDEVNSLGGSLAEIIYNNLKKNPEVHIEKGSENSGRGSQE